MHMGMDRCRDPHGRRAFCVIVRVFDFVPPPHFLEHFPHADHLECLQLTGHALLLHTAFCEVAPHLRPPNLSFWVTLRVEMCVDISVDMSMDRV